MPTYGLGRPCWGLPHSEISGSMLASCSPERFVGRHVLLRLCVPRYPPLALCSLTYFFSLIADAVFKVLYWKGFPAFSSY